MFILTEAPEQKYKYLVFYNVLTGHGGLRLQTAQGGLTKTNNSMLSCAPYDVVYYKNNCLFDANSFLTKFQTPRSETGASVESILLQTLPIVFDINKQFITDTYIDTLPQANYRFQLLPSKSSLKSIHGLEYWIENSSSLRPFTVVKIHKEDSNKIDLIIADITKNTRIISKTDATNIVKSIVRNRYPLNSVELSSVLKDIYTQLEGETDVDIKNDISTIAANAYNEQGDVIPAKHYISHDGITIACDDIRMYDSPINTKDIKEFFSEYRKAKGLVYGFLNKSGEVVYIGVSSEGAIYDRGKTYIKNIQNDSKNRLVIQAIQQGKIYGFVCFKHNFPNIGTYSIYSSIILPLEKYLSVEVFKTYNLKNNDVDIEQYNVDIPGKYSAKTTSDKVDMRKKHVRKLISDAVQGIKFYYTASDFYNSEGSPFGLKLSTKHNAIINRSVSGFISYADYLQDVSSKLLELEDWEKLKRYFFNMSHPVTKTRNIYDYFMSLSTAEKLDFLTYMFGPDTRNTIQRKVTPRGMFLNYVNDIETNQVMNTYQILNDIDDEKSLYR